MGFHLLDLIAADAGDARRSMVAAQLCEVEEALKRWLQAKIDEIESALPAHGDGRMISKLCDSEEEVLMAKDERDMLELLRTELDFLERGGYRRSVRTPWKPTSPFRYSLTCVNYALPEKAHPCSECHLIDFVPSDRRNEELPCHYIPLNDQGETAADLELHDNQAKLEEALKHWLRARIEELELERNTSAQAI